MNTPEAAPAATTIPIEVVVPAEAASFSGGLLRAQLEDVSTADESAIYLVRQTWPGITHQQGQETLLTMSLSLPPSTDLSARIVASAHLDRTGTGQGIKRGDLITTQNYPITNLPWPIRIHLRPL